MVEFINLIKGRMSVLKYSLKFTKLSKYAPSLVSNPRDEMNCFVKKVSHDLQQECNLAMIHDHMNISCLIVHAQQLEEARANRKSRDKTSLSLRRGSIIKFLQCSLRCVMMG